MCYWIPEVSGNRPGGLKDHVKVGTIEPGVQAAEKDGHRMVDPQMMALLQDRGLVNQIVQKRTLPFRFQRSQRRV